MHADAQQPVDLVERQRVIEIASIRRVDGERDAMPQVAIPFVSKRALDARLCRCRLRERIIGKARRKRMARDDEIDIDACIALVSHNLFDAAECRLSRFRIGGDARAYDIALAHRRRISAQREDIMPDARIFRNDDSVRLGDFVASHDRRMRTRHHARDASLRPIRTPRPTIPISTGCSGNSNDIAVEG